MNDALEHMKDQIYVLEDENDKLREESDRIREDETAERERLEAVGAALKEVRLCLFILLVSFLTLSYRNWQESKLNSRK